MKETPTIEQAAEEGILRMLSGGHPWSKTDLIYNVAMNRDRRFRYVDMQVAVEGAVKRLSDVGLIEQLQASHGRYRITESGEAAYKEQVVRDR